MIENQKLVEDNMNLVYHVIHKEFSSYSHDEDVIQTGMLGLCRAANNWDESKGVFSTFAYKYIRGLILTELQARNKNKGVLSLEFEYEDDCTLADMVCGEPDVDYVDDSFEKQLNDTELMVFRMKRKGYTISDIATKIHRSRQRVEQILRRIQYKGSKFYAD